MTVESWGTGRKDFSQNVEYSTTPIIRSYQSQYVETESGTLDAGDSTTINTAVTTDYVVMLYDFLLAANANVLLNLLVSAIGTDDSVASVVRDRQYQRIYHQILPGFPFFGTIRSVITNNGDISADYEYMMAGITTSEKEYNLIIGGV